MAEKKTKKEKVKVVAKDNSVILGPRITEKSAMGAEKGVYTFNVLPTANKSEIIKAIKTLYKVVPEKISITVRPEKKVFRRGVMGTKQGGKKAVVYLKKGDKITFA